MWVDDSSYNIIDAGEKIIRVVGKAKGANVTIGGFCGDFVVSFISTGLPENIGGVNIGGIMLLRDLRGDSEARVIRVYVSGRIRRAAYAAQTKWNC
jgi:hypothetical protein